MRRPVGGRQLLRRPELPGEQRGRRAPRQQASATRRRATRQPAEQRRAASGAASRTHSAFPDPTCASGRRATSRAQVGDVLGDPAVHPRESERRLTGGTARRAHRRAPARAAGRSRRSRARWPAGSRPERSPNCSQRIGAVAAPQATETASTSRAAAGTGYPSSHRCIRGTTTKIAPTAANESWKPGSSRLAGVQASRTAAPRARKCHRSRGRETSQASEASAPATPARTTDGCQPTART